MLNGNPYCRKCISFRGEEVEHKASSPKKAPIHLEYELSPEQKELSDKLVENYKKGIDSLVYAVCGSGKTEISLQIISYVIKQRGKVAFAIPRRDVVIELSERLKSIFKENKITVVYGGHTEDLNGDIICLTTHQLYRYKHYFDLLIIDEIDAFPYKGDKVLNEIAKRSVKGHKIYMSATVSKADRDNFIKSGGEVLELFNRYHNYPLPVPKIYRYNSFIIYFALIRYVGQLLKQDKPLFIFVPTIDYSQKIYRILKLFYRDGNYVNSKRQNRNQIIEDFKKKNKGYLVTTAVLERGVTLEGLQVIVFKADHPVYDTGALVQIAGRVGRKIKDPKGEVIFLVNEKNKRCEEAVSNIEKSNKNLQNMF